MNNTRITKYFSCRGKKKIHSLHFVGMLTVSFSNQNWFTFIDLGVKGNSKIQEEENSEIVPDHFSNFER